MKQWVIRRKRTTKTGDEIKEFFCFAENKTEAVRRFCYVTGERKTSIIGIMEITQK